MTIQISQHLKNSYEHRGSNITTQMEKNVEKQRIEMASDRIGSFSRSQSSDDDSCNFNRFVYADTTADVRYLLERPTSPCPIASPVYIQTSFPSYIRVFNVQGGVQWENTLRPTFQNQNLHSMNDSNLASDIGIHPKRTDGSFN